MKIFDERLKDEQRYYQQRVVIFVIGKHNETYQNFLDWVEKEKLEDYIMYHFPEGVTNPNYQENGRNLVPVVMCSKEHMWREQLKGNHEE